MDRLWDLLAEFKRDALLVQINMQYVQQYLFSISTGLTIINKTEDERQWDTLAPWFCIFITLFLCYVFSTIYLSVIVWYLQ